MTSVIGDFLQRVDFNSYEDFFENFKLKYNEDYNFGFDVCGLGRLFAFL